jgi:hypothetical protein
LSHIEEIEMSTRCQIASYYSKDQDIEKWDALIYRHWDGYPGAADGSEVGVLADIVPFLEWFATERGLDDPEYAAARLLQYLCNKQDNSERTLPHQNWRGSEEFGVGTLGHGISSSIHCDIEYFYRVYPSKVLVYKVNGGLPTDEQEPDLTITVA